MKVETVCRKLLDEFRSRPTLRAGSLITTVFGDSVAPRGGNVWLGSLIRAMAHFGINERLVRTSVYRLAKDDWLQSEQLGRRSYYGLTPTGRERFAAATERIYGEPNTEWDGNWCLVLLAALDTVEKDSVRKEFAWLGFGQLSANLLAHPRPGAGDVETTLRRLHLTERTIVLRGQTVHNDTGMRQLARNTWDLVALGQRYQSFVQRFRPVLRAVETEASIRGETAFLLRTLLIQEYRKVLLRDPQLPEPLLPADWQGGAAYQLCRNLYLALYRDADNYLTETMQSADGALPPPSGDYWHRFGGLKQRKAG